MMNRKIFFKKLNEKMGFKVPEIGRMHKEDYAKSRKEQSEGHHTSKACVCGTHSIKGYKEHSKYPRWKKTLPTIKVKTKEERIMRDIFIDMSRDGVQE